MKTLRPAFFIFGIAMLFVISAFPLPVYANPPTGYDLAAAVNAYRAANGYYALNPNSLVMSAAQTHAEWIVETGQGGHIGANGSDETVRVSWTGYGGGAAIQCDENWAGGTSIDEAVYGSWSDWVHQEVMLNAWGNRYTDIGGGVAERGDGRYVFVLNVCMVIGQGYSGEVPDSSAAPPADGSGILTTPDASNYIFGVVQATPLADGSIKHIVQYGQTLAAIADAYGVTIESIRELNEMAADETIIWTEQELLVKSGSGLMPTESLETSPAAISPTPSPTETPQPNPTMAVSPETSPTPQTRESAPANQTLGALLVITSGVGLVILLYLFSTKKSG